HPRLHRAPAGRFGQCRGSVPGRSQHRFRSDAAGRTLWVPFLAGASTVSAAMRLADRGLSAREVFPAEQSGGVGFLKAVAGPLPQLRFCPTGGINPQNAASYLALPNVGCVGGSWLAPKDLLAAGEWGRVEELAREAASLR